MSAQDWSRVVRKGKRKGSVDASTIPVTVSKCGTNSGYSAHYYYNNLPPCEPCKQARKEYLIEYNNSNPEARKRRWVNWKSRNPNYKKAYHKAKPEQSRSDARRRRARKRKVKVIFYLESDVIGMYGNNCHICGDSIDLTASRKQGVGDWKYGLHIDHIVPISSGGSDTIDNVRPSHVICNLRKGSNGVQQEKKEEIKVN